ncbi:translocation/assembly module TamB domain-containing protein [Pseudoflavitalea rhizosphaerae]|uniref:translocation/assembly module TamB domain-containing protein n=1 Tax=Pseudoflavitalea rhizosphaerae TaxID=1884793 RepID=UPI000F8C3A3A|nr:translocation/assembly module TamB domain-containing protein [Pseudoflavitalea rhizosphaerae]
MLVLIALIVLVWLALQTTPVQNWLVKQVTHRLSKDLQTTVSIRHVDFALFNKMSLEGTLIKDRLEDTLLYAGALRVNITDWFFFKDKTELKYLGLHDAVIHLNRTDSIWNYRFIIDHFAGPKETSSGKGSINLDLKTIDLNNVTLHQKDAWRGEDQLLRIGSLDIDAQHVSLADKQLFINTIVIDKPLFAILNYDGNRPDSLRPKRVDTTYTNDPDHLRWNAGNWDIRIANLRLKDGTFKSDVQNSRKPYDYFDGAHIQFSDIQGDFRDVRFKQDSITGKIKLSTIERSGLVVKNLNANLKWHPEAMEFHNLDLRTNRSHLHHFFAMRYNTFDDMSDFITKVRMEGNFDEAYLDSDDIAFFAPEMKEWKKKVRINGKVRGSIDNLSARKITIESGQNAYLNGNISLRGLPDIDKTFIDFEATDFRTTYKDAITIIPQLKNITQPRLDHVEYLHFRGNFTGFVKDFVTYGTIETNLGALITDVNMKFPDVGHTSYSGNIKTTGFDLGRFLDVPQLGRISFQGSVNGQGLRTGNLNAKLDGKIQSLEANGYDYRNIEVKGTVAKRLFNGELMVNDSNLVAKLNGLVDFSQQLPEFNFNADISKMNLKNLKLAKDSIEGYGKFDFDFTGNNIDNFLGTARIYDASVFKNSRRISFDSLYVESKVMGNNKVITVLSNEFDAALVGDFSIMELPSAFRSFLNKYFPSYIKPATTLKNENFSFVITTKKVEDYLDFVDKNLGGFNFSTVAGRINSKENMLDLNAEVPQFNYKNLTVYNVSLKGIGNRDSLSLESTIADVYINDSLHFPGTSIKIGSANDLSRVTVKTSASQTINAASIAAKVQTMPRGVRITFDQSNFDVNGKNWLIEKDGEMVFSDDLVSADGVRIYSGDQEILVTTHPSDIGNTNDVRVSLKKINIGDFAPYVVKKNRLEGLLNANIDIMDPFRKMQVDLSGEAEQFRLDDDSIGNITLSGNYSMRSGIVNFGAISNNENYNFNLTGAYTIKDSTNTRLPLDINGEFTHMRIKLLQQYLSGVFSDLDGYATGGLRVSGPTDELNYTGQVALKDAQLRVNYTNVLYKIPAASFDFRDGFIDFGAFPIKDEFGNSGSVSKGILKHKGFDDLEFDFAMNTNKLLVLATNGTGKDAYFGTVFAKANMSLKGPLADMRMDIRGEPADSSKLYIRSGPSRESGQADFIVWKVYGREMTPPKQFQESNLTVNLDISANNYADMYVILDELTGDIIKANGHGNLKIKAGTDGDFTIIGRYDIDRGNYNFSFQSFLRKPFTLREGVGNYIQWKGDPYDADIKVDAEYHAENVRFSDLGLDQFSIQAGTSGGVNNAVRKYRGEVVVVASLTEKLMRPVIKFAIELPQGSALKNDPDALAILQRIQNDENELNKQVAFLIVFNSFGPLQTGSQSGLGNIAFEGVVIGSISGMVSGALSKWSSNIFQKIFNDKSIKVNFNAQLYSGYNLVDNTDRNRINYDRSNLNLNIGKSFLNERLTFTFGSALDFGLSTEQVQATKNLQFLPDITAEWKIRPDGKLVLTFFYRDSYNYLTGTGVGARQNRSGASISYRRDFDNFGELFRGERKRKPKAAAPPAPKKVDSADAAKRN